jgi:Septum formation initiator
MGKKKRKKISKASKRRLMIFGTLSLVVMTYVCINLVTYTYRIKKLTDEQNKLATELKQMKESEKELKNEIKKLNDEDYLARFAREEYYYTKDGEYVIKLDEDNQTKKQEDKDFDLSEYKVQIIVASIIILSVIVIVLRTLKKDK